MESLSSVINVVCMACDGAPESIKMAMSQAPAFFAAFGGCNRKVDVALCGSLVTLVASFLDVAKVSTLEAVGPCSSVVEKATGFLAKAALAEDTDDTSGPDAPVL